MSRTFCNVADEDFLAVHGGGDLLVLETDGNDLDAFPVPVVVAPLGGLGVASKPAAAKIAAPASD